MKHWKQVLLASALAGALAVPFVVRAEEGTNPGAPIPGQLKQTIQHQWEGHQPAHKQHRGRHALFLGAHRKMYLTLLAEKYTPGSVAEWKAAFAERERLVAEWKARKATEQPSDAERQARREQFTKLAQELKAKVAKGELTKEQMKEQLAQWREEHGGKDRKGLREALQPFKQVHEEFDAAIKSQDAAAIRAVLPKLLDEVKTVNRHLAAKLEQKKS
ncbi:hypothetical protein G3578_17555 [Brevibacillus sp. SYP-B805]|uniref:hypothetical protein n=1 Tax=Brevibacillus sp. SYP-B805 TaxID=1578199 RepID=UPI0013ED8A3F|nr:hypothetical protein [Brevibacillus sp. SYP-B805]NGQ96972.1 hypothetical protein [Brevibacillus sp. SYP-B805]